MKKYILASILSCLLATAGTALAVGNLTVTNNTNKSIHFTLVSGERFSHSITVEPYSWLTSDEICKKLSQIKYFKHEYKYYGYWVKKPNTSRVYKGAMGCNNYPYTSTQYFLNITPDGKWSWSYTKPQ